MNRGDFRSKLARALDTDTTSPLPWTTAQLDQIIAEGHETFVELAEPIERHMHIPLVGGKVWYRLSSLTDDLIMPLRLIDLDANRRLIAMTLSEMDEGRTMWETTTGQPQWWTTAGFDWIAIWPHAATSAGLLRLDYAAWPQDALDDNVPLEVDEEDEDRIFSLAFADCQAWQQTEATRALEKLAEFAGAVGLSRFRAQSRTAFKQKDERRVTGIVLP